MLFVLTKRFPLITIKYTGGYNKLRHTKPDIVSIEAYLKFKMLPKSPGKALLLIYI